MDWLDSRSNLVGSKTESIKLVWPVPVDPFHSVRFNLARLGLMPGSCHLFGPTHGSRRVKCCFSSLELNGVRIEIPKGKLVTPTVTRKLD